MTVNNYKKIEDQKDIQALKTGMIVYKFPLRGKPCGRMDLYSSNLQELTVVAIDKQYIVLSPIDNFTEFPFLAKNFDRLIADGKWWFQKE